MCIIAISLAPYLFYKFCNTHNHVKIDTIHIPTKKMLYAFIFVSYITSCKTRDDQRINVFAFSYNNSSPDSVRVRNYFSAHQSLWQMDGLCCKKLGGGEGVKGDFERKKRERIWQMATVVWRSFRRICLLLKMWNANNCNLQYLRSETVGKWIFRTYTPPLRYANSIGTTFSVCIHEKNNNVAAVNPEGMLVFRLMILHECAHNIIVYLVFW